MPSAEVTSSGKIGFNWICTKQMHLITILSSNLNGPFFKEQYISAVEGLYDLLASNIDQRYIEEIKNLKTRFNTAVGKLPTNERCTEIYGMNRDQITLDYNVKKAREKYRSLIRLMSRKSLLPKNEVIDEV